MPFSAYLHQQVDSINTQITKLKKQIKSIQTTQTTHTTQIAQQIAQTTITTTQKDITFLSSFTDGFSVDSSALEINSNSNWVQLTVTATRTGSNTLMNTTYQVGTIPSSCYPTSDISGLFPYGGGITDIGSLFLDSAGNLSIRTGNNASIPNGSTFTFTVLYVI